MNNRKAKFLFAKPGDRLRISDRKIVFMAQPLLPYWSYCIGTKRSAAQNRWKNHCYLVESKGAQS
ncbi:hypothetical protein [Phytobacter diazotrophicus]|uniref:hypothetical protein n=1 Tax=Phytobacter diazotrophicus TaxID=395631 RepID=UPI002FFD040A